MSKQFSFSSLMGGSRQKQKQKQKQQGGAAHAMEAMQAQAAQMSDGPMGVESALTQSLSSLQQGGRSRRYRRSKQSRRPKQSRKSKKRSPSKGAFPNGIFRNVF